MRYTKVGPEKGLHIPRMGFRTFVSSNFRVKVFRV